MSDAIDRRRFPEPALLAVAIALVAACARRPAVDEEAGGARLMRNLLLSGRVEIVVDPGPLEEECLRRAARRGDEDDITLAVRMPGSAGDPRAARIVVGTRSMGLARSLLARLAMLEGVEKGKAWFAWQDQRFSAPEDGVVATFEDPERPGLPLTLVYGNDERFLARYLGDLSPGWKPWIALYRSGALAVAGPLWLSGEVIPQRVEHPWLAQTEILARQVEVANASAAVEIAAAPQDLIVYAPPALVADARSVTWNARARERVREWAAPDGKAPRLVVRLYADLEGFVRLHGAARPGRVNPIDRSAHILVGGGFPEDGGRTVAEATALELLGPPAEPWMLDAAATDACRLWWGMALERWNAWLARGPLVPGLATLVDARADERFSPHLIVPLRAALFRYLIETRGDSFVRQVWRGTARLVHDDATAVGFRAWLEERAALQAWFVDARREQRRVDLGGMALRGAVMEQPPTPGADGYGSARYGAALDAVRALGADAVELESFLVDELDPFAHAGAHASHAPSAPYATLGPASIEGDLRLAAAVGHARMRQCRTLVSVHVLGAPGGTWSGSWSRQGLGDWNRFFERYERSLVHAALLAELCGVDVLSVGAGLPAVASLTLDGPRARYEIVEWKRAGWTRILGSARSCFAGALTYAALSLAEAEKIGFWSELDAVSLSIADRLAVTGPLGEPQARLELRSRIAGALQSISALARRHERPLLLVHTGFAARPRAPGRARFGPGSIDPELTSAALDDLANMLQPYAAEKRVNGLFLSRWSTDPALEAASAGVFRPGTPAVDRALARALASL